MSEVFANIRPTRLGKRKRKKGTSGYKKKRSKKVKSKISTVLTPLINSGEDILSHIFSYFDISYLSNLRGVSKSFNNIISNKVKDLGFYFTALVNYPQFNIFNYSKITLNTREQLKCFFLHVKYKIKEFTFIHTLKLIRALGPNSYSYIKELLKFKRTLRNLHLNMNYIQSYEILKNVVLELNLVKISIHECKPHTEEDYFCLKNMLCIPYNTRHTKRSKYVEINISSFVFPSFDIFKTIHTRNLVLRWEGEYNVKEVQKFVDYILENPYLESITIENSQLSFDQIEQLVFDFCTNDDKILNLKDIYLCYKDRASSEKRVVKFVKKLCHLSKESCYCCVNYKINFKDQSINNMNGGMWTCSAINYLINHSENNVYRDEDEDEDEDESDSDSD